VTGQDRAREKDGNPPASTQDSGTAKHRGEVTTVTGRREVGRWLWKLSEVRRGNLNGDQRAIGAFAAESAVFDVNPFHGVRRRHHALVIRAVNQIHGVSQLVDGFCEKTPREDVATLFESVEFLPQAMGGDDGTAASQHCFAKDKRQNGDVKINFRHAEHSP
jgi:hypothetical protein